MLTWLNTWLGSQYTHQTLTAKKASDRSTTLRPASSLSFESLSGGVSVRIQRDSDQTQNIQDLEDLDHYITLCTTLVLLNFGR